MYVCHSDHFSDCLVDGRNTIPSSTHVGSRRYCSVELFASLKSVTSMCVLLATFNKDSQG